MEDGNKTIETLPDKFVGGGEVSGFLFEKVFENETGYVYKVCTEDSEHFEALVRKVVPKCIDFKNKIFSTTDFKETYPKAKHFGSSAWTVASVEAGIEKLQKILKTSMKITKEKMEELGWRHTDSEYDCDQNRYYLPKCKKGWSYWLDIRNLDNIWLSFDENDGTSWLDSRYKIEGGSIEDDITEIKKIMNEFEIVV